MRKKNLLILVFSLIFLYSTIIKGVTLSYSPSFTNMNSFHLLLNNNHRVQPFFGLDYIYLKLRLVEPGDHVKFNANLVSPKLGAKYLLVIDNDLQLYLVGSVQILIPKIEISNPYDSTEDIEEMSHELEKALDLKIFRFAIGSDYFFSPSFSISGEYGFNYFLGSSKSELIDEFLDFDFAEFGLGVLSSKIWINFHF